MTDLFWFFAVPTLLLAALVLAGFLVETVWPRAQRNWRKRLRRIEAGRARMAKEAKADMYGEERKRAAQWIATHCFWIPEDRR
jgi:F0F1-type ATP synthase membrane subunit b/b'